MAVEDQNFEDLLVTRHGFRLDVVLNRPKVKNAMSSAMVEELKSIFSTVDEDPSIRVITLSGAEGTFCAGGDIKDMAGLRAAAADGGGDQVFIDFNRNFGTMLQLAQSCGKVIIACVEGAAMGGGFGLAAAADITIATESARFGMPEVNLGITPAQISPFVVQRIGLAGARRLALTGARITGAEAVKFGLVDDLATDRPAMEALLGDILGDIKKAAPSALAKTKALLMAAQAGPTDAVLDMAAKDFATQSQSQDAMEGGMAFIQKRLPSWAAE